MVAGGGEASAHRVARSSAEGDGVPGGGRRSDRGVDLHPEPVDRGEQGAMLLAGRRIGVRVDVEQGAMLRCSARRSVSAAGGAGGYR